MQTKCGYVAIVGRPNVGKSTLLNHILGCKLSITSRKPQTTRHQILGIKTQEQVQTIYVDTPGIHKSRKRALNRYLNKAAMNALQGVDVILWVVEKLKWLEEEKFIASALEKVKIPIFIVVNKIDQIEQKEKLLAHLQFISEQIHFTEVIPVCAKTGYNIPVLERLIAEHLPVGEHQYPAEQMTDRSERFLAAEIIREKITRQLGDELPYAMTVQIEEFKEINNILHINAVILVERPSQKIILIGEAGQRLKRIGQQARLDMEKLFGSKIMLRLWAKVKRDWSDDQAALNHLGYGD